MSVAVYEVYIVYFIICSIVLLYYTFGFIKDHNFMESGPILVLAHQGPC